VKDWPFHYGVVVLAVLVLVVFAALGLGRFGYTSILPAMQAGLGLSNTQTGELQSWNLLGYLLAAVFAGLLATRHSPRLVIAAALFVAGLGMILTGLIPALGGARLGRFLAGVGGAGANLPALGLVSAWFGARRRGLAAGIVVSGSSLGLMVTGPLVPIVLARYGEHGWRVAWYALGAAALAIMLLAVLLLRDAPADLGLAPLGGTEAERGAPRAAGAAWGQLWASPMLWQLALLYFAFGFSYVIYATFFIRALVGEGGFGAREAGVLWLQIGILSTASGFLWGGISDRWGRRLALMGVFALQGASFLAFGWSLGRAVVYLSAVLFGLTAWGVPALMAAVLGDAFGARLASAALGVLTLALGTGQVIGPYFAGWMADATRSFSPAFLAAGLVALLFGMGGAFFLPRPSNR
jgi:MFS family permease